MKYFTVSLTGTYTRDEIPPRCRKPRPVTHETSTQVEIPMVSSDDAPVAFRIRGLEDRIKEIRTHDGRLFAPYLPEAHQTGPSRPGSAHFPQVIDTEQGNLHQIIRDADSDEDFRQQAQKHYHRFLIIDGTVWREASEPGYSVTTFGLGNNHGGTSLMVDTSRGMVFRADEFDAALAYAIQVAAERGDTEYVSRFKGNPERYRDIEVLIPEAVTLVTPAPVSKEVRNLRVEYSIACYRLDQATTPDEEAEAFESVSRLRSEIIERGYSPVKSDARPYEARHGAKEAL